MKTPENKRCDILISNSLAYINSIDKKVKDI